MISESLSICLQEIVKCMTTSIALRLRSIDEFLRQSCERKILCLLQGIICNVSEKNLSESDVESKLRVINIVLNLIWEEMHMPLLVRSYQHVLTCFNLAELQSISCLVAIYFKLLVLNGDLNLQSIVYFADLGILMGNDSEVRQLLIKIADIASLELQTRSKDDKDPFMSKSNKRSYKMFRQPVMDSNLYYMRGPSIQEVPADSFSMNSFYNHMQQSKPVIIRKGAIDWTAISCWKNLDFWYQHRHRLVPVELGDNYLAHNASSSLLSLGDFMSDFIVNENEIKGYLAQHKLLDQIPSLRKYISIPDYTALLLPDDEIEGSDESTDVIVNCWFGPIGTISPLHHDPYHNLLVQVVGRKYIRLYDKSESNKLYVREAPWNNNRYV